MKKQSTVFKFTYVTWLVLFVVIPIIFLVIQSLRQMDGQFSLHYYVKFFSSSMYWQLMVNSVLYATFITGVTLLLGYPMALFLSQLKHKQLWLMLIILPTWINLLLKAYAFMGILAKDGALNQVIATVGLGEVSLLFTGTGFVLVASYIELPFMIMPIFTAMETIKGELLQASQDLGATRWQTFRYVVWPLSLDGVKSGVQAVFIPALSLFMLTRLIAGNRVMTLGTAIEQHFLVTQNWGMGATIGVVLISMMALMMWLTRKEKK